MLPFSNYQPDLRRIKQNGVRVVMAAGQLTLTKKKFYGQTAPILARRLGGECVTFPGHHLSYFDLAEEWAATLRGVLHNTADVLAA
jgi:hypothetical protein